MKTYNTVELKGRLHSHNLTEKDDAIVGTVKLEVAEDGTLVEAKFFAKPTYSSGKPNGTYSYLEKIMNGEYKTIADEAKGETADWLSFDKASITIDYYAGRNTAVKTIEDLNRSQKIRGCFISDNRQREYKNVWKCDTLITRIEDVEADPEKNKPHFVKVHGYIFEPYYERSLEVVFDAYSDAAINYLLGLGDTVSKENPLYTSIKGEFKQIKTLITKEGAFGEDETIEYANVRWNLTWMPRNTYTVGEDVTAEELDGYMTNLEEYKQKRLEENSASASEEEKIVF